MKAKMMSLAAAVLLLFSCGPTTYESTSSNAAFDVPADIRTSFSTQYPNAANITWSHYDVVAVPIDWELSGWTVLNTDDYAASFTMDGTTYYAYYDAAGDWVGTAYVISDHSKLPTAVQTALQSKYGGYVIEKVDMEIWRDQTAYEVKLKSGDTKIKLLMDANGNVLKEKLR